MHVDRQQRPARSRDGYRLVAFDVDGTLVSNGDQQVVWQLFNRHILNGSGADPARMQAYLSGHITYAEWVELDVREWMDAGVTRQQMEAVIREHLCPTPGAAQTLWALKGAGYRLAVISGTIDLTLDLLFPEHPFEEVHTNRLMFDEGGLIRGWEATPYDMAGKALALREMAGRMGIEPSQTVFVGDNTNDVEVMNEAGLAIAYEAKDPSVSQAADAEVRGDMAGVLRLLGL